jgi:hypothetical protein
MGTKLDDFIAECKAHIKAGGSIIDNGTRTYFTAIQLGWVGHLGEWTDCLQDRDRKNPSAENVASKSVGVGSRRQKATRSRKAKQANALESIETWLEEE